MRRGMVAKKRDEVSPVVGAPRGESRERRARRRRGGASLIPFHMIVSDVKFLKVYGLRPFGSCLRPYKYRFKILYWITVVGCLVKVHKTKSLKLGPAAARP